MKYPLPNEGISWLTIFEQGLHQVTYAKDACDLLGKGYRRNKYYLALESKQNHHLCRPTISDGKLGMQFRPFCDDSNWGLTLTSGSFEKGFPETVKKDTRELVELKKYFLPLNENIPRDQDLMETYFENEKKEFKRKNAQAFNDLMETWGQ